MPKLLSVVSSCANWVACLDYGNWDEMCKGGRFGQLKAFPERDLDLHRDEWGSNAEVQGNYTLESLKVYLEAYKVYNFSL